MENTFNREYTVLTSMCDADGRLGIRNVFDVFMDLAGSHADELGVGYHAMLDRHCYWVAVRTRVRLYRRPSLGESFSAVTWPGKPGLAKSDRFYRLAAAGEVLAEGRTEWAVSDLDTGAVRRTDSYGYPLDMIPREEKVCAEPFTRFRDTEPRPEDELFNYTVISMDIDVGRHMNNVAYVRMLLGTFTTDELSSMDISEAEISYRVGCFEGEELCISRRFEDNAWWFLVQKPGGEAAVHARLLLR